MSSKSIGASRRNTSPRPWGVLAAVLVLAGTPLRADSNPDWFQGVKRAEVPVAAAKALTAPGASEDGVKKRRIRSLVNQIARQHPQTMPFAVRAMIRADPGSAPLIRAGASEALPELTTAIHWAADHAGAAPQAPTRVVQSRAVRPDHAGDNNGKGHEKHGEDHGTGAGQGKGKGNGKGRGQEHGLGHKHDYNH